MPDIARLHKWAARFEPRDDTDALVVTEVWARNDYRIGPAGLTGVVVDVGANVGAFSVLAVRAGADVVHAYEPHPGNRARLEHHLSLNRVADRVVVHPEAVAEKSGDVVWLTGSGGGVHIAGEGDATARTVSLADILGEVGPVDFLKHDAEGAEWQTFESVTAPLLSEQVRRIALEWHGPDMGPHLTHIGADGRYKARWHRLVEVLADSGRLEIVGHPTVGGLMYWSVF